MTNYYLDQPETNELDASSELVSTLVKRKLSKEEINVVLDNYISGLDPVGMKDFFANALRNINFFFHMGNQMYENLPSDSIIPVMVQVISESLNAGKTTIYLNDPERNELITRTAQGEWVPIRIANDNGVIGSVFKSGKTEILNNISGDQRLIHATDARSSKQVQNLIVVPLKTRSEKTIGVIEVTNKEDGNFTKQDASLLEAIAIQAAVALRNGELYRQVKTAYAEEKKLINIGHELTSELQLMPLIDKILTITVDLLDADRSTIFLHDPAAKELWALDGKGDVAKKIRFPDDKGIAGSVFTQEKNINITDAYSDSRFNPEFDQKIGYHTQTILCIPLLHSSGTCVGVIQAINKKGGSFSLTDEKRLEVLAEHASIAIENAKVFKNL